VTDLDSPELWPALAREIDSTFSLLSAADRNIQQLQSLSDDIDPLMACLAAGVERLLKLVHGLATVETTGCWPSKKEMQHTLNHKISDLDRIGRGHIVAGLEQSVHRVYVEGLLTKADGQPVLHALLDVLTRYASGGRFHNLDKLAESPPSLPSPLQLWEDMELSLMQARPELLALIGEPNGYEQVRGELNEQIGVALRDWWILYVRAGMQGCFGERGRRWLSGRMPPS
jgi:hypothetical protein